MAKIELELDEETLRRVQHQADAQHTTVEEWFAGIVKQHTEETPKPNVMLGLFSDAPEIMDEVMALIREDRKNQPPPREYDFE